MTTAREYLRVSYDSSGRQRSNDEQAGENRATFPELTFNGSAYSDVGSASKYATKHRGDFDALVADLRADRFDADVLVLWEGSRGSRRVGEWVALLELCEDHGVKIAVTLAERLYDPANPTDRRELISAANDAEYESAKISKRTRRAAAAGAAQGRPHGRLPYGYRRRYEATPKGPRLVAQEPEPAEAAVVVELYERVAQGHSLRSIADDFARRGIEKRSGGPFSDKHLRTMLPNPIYRGQRAHVVGRSDGKRRPGAAVELSEGTWPALVPDTLWLTVNHRISDPARKTTRPGRGKHLLSLIARCDVCAAPLAARWRKGVRVYECHERSCVRLSADALDDLAESVIVSYLRRPGNVERLVAADPDSAELEAARTAVATVQAEMDDLADQVGRGKLSATLAARAEPAVIARLRQAETRAAELTAPNSLAGLLSPGDDIRARWAEAPLPARREIARLVLTPAIIGELRVTRSPTKGRWAPVEERVTWRTS